jgi:mRNA interferase RelE/StbE
MPYTVIFRSSAVKELRKLPEAARKQVVIAVDLLANEPRPRGVKKMAGMEAWRIRVGDYRIVYSIADQQLVIEIIKIGNRREVYR